MASKSELKRFRSNLSDERDSAALYETLADAEHDVERKQVYTELAASERDHAQVWSEKLRKWGKRSHASGER
jgi:rubrerythrin